MKCSSARQSSKYHESRFTRETERVGERERREIAEQQLETDVRLSVCRRLSSKSIVRLQVQLQRQYNYVG